MKSRNVVVRFRGRIGNQLFQYWTAYAVARRLKADLWVEPSAVAPELGHLVTLAPASEKILGETLGKSGFLGRWHRFWQRLKTEPNRSFWQDRFGAYNPRLSRASSSCFLDGYWQSFRYFEHLPVNSFDGVRHELERLALPDPWLERARTSVVVHVRRTDFVAMGISLPDSYYREAMERFPGYHFLVVTDDPEYCSRLFLHKSEVEVVTNEFRTAWQDLNLMVHAAGLIIANSTFSWWGAYLNIHPEKKVITPKSWLAPEPGFVYKLSDVYPSAWEQI